MPDGQYLVSIEATDSHGESIVADLPLLIGSNLSSQPASQSMSSAFLRQMSSDALANLLHSQTLNPSDLSASDQIALRGLDNLATFNSSSMRAEMEAGRFHFSPSITSDLPLLAIYSDESSIIDSDAILQSGANLLLQGSKLSSDEVEAPLGALEFSLTSQKESTVEVVNIAMAEGGVNLNRLFKSTNTGQLEDFHSEIIVPPDGLSASQMDKWLHDLSYSIYDYSLKTSVNKDVATYSLSNGFTSDDTGFPSDYDFSSLDGSAYLVDFNDDGLTDLISLALVDQGYFDLDSQVVSLRALLFLFLIISPHEFRL